MTQEESEIVLDATQEIKASCMGIEIHDIVQKCRHMVGLDYKRPYRRHGRTYYRAYRNYFEAPPDGDDVLEALLGDFVSVHQQSPERSRWYRLTKAGMEWLGRQLSMTIYGREERK